MQEILRCNICESIFHFVRDCPDYMSEFPKKKNEIKLQYYKLVTWQSLTQDVPRLFVVKNG